VQNTKHTRGKPARCQARKNNAALPGASSEGFQTTALPHKIAGMIFQDGTANGKLPR